jgi:hypothetical protein
LWYWGLNSRAGISRRGLSHLSHTPSMSLSLSS